MNDDASGKQVLVKSSEGNQKQAMQGSRSWTGHQDYTLAHSLTRSGVWEGQEYRTVHHQCNLLSYTCALLKLTKRNNE